MDNHKYQSKQGLYRFGDFSLDTIERRLRYKSEKISLAPKQFDLLFYFVANAGRVAKKNELLDAVWADTYVEETTLARNISWLRKLLEKNSDGERIIETIPKLGYRFTAEVIYSNTDDNLLVVEEQIIQHVHGEEIITISNSPINTENIEKRIENNNLISAKTPSYRNVSKSIILAVLALIIFAAVGFFSYRIYFKTDSSQGLNVSNTVLFTGAFGNENSPAFSDDSKMIAYSWNGDEGIESDIYVKMIGVGDPIQLTSTKENEHYPVFSPDSKHIAFVRGKYGEPGEVFLIPTFGGIERKVARLFSGNYSISFSPDGKNIAVVDTEDSQPGKQFAIYLVNIQTGERRRLTEPGEFDGESTPRFSPDGKSLAFIRSTKNVNIPGIGQHDLFVVSTDGGKAAQLTFEGTIIHSLAWSFDSKFIYFVPYGPPSQTFIKRISAHGGQPDIVPVVGNDVTNIALSPDGKKLIYAENPWLFSIWRVLNNGQKAEVLNKATVNQGSPTFSADGKRIAFNSDRTRILQIWIMDADGKNMRQITNDSFPSTSPQFSPDGDYIAFNRKKPKDSAIYIIPAEGGKERRLSQETAQDDFPFWSADGNFIYFISRISGESNLWKIKVESEDYQPVQITKNGAAFATPAFDNKFIYFKKEGIDKELWQIPASGGEEKLLTEFTSHGFSGSWIMQKTGIYFLVRNSDQSYQMKFYDFADQQIKDAPGSYNIPTDIDANCFTANEKEVLCSVMEKSSHLTLADLQ